MGLNTIPSDLSGLTQGEEKIANKIKTLYTGNTKDCYLYVKPRLRNLEPDFILIDPTKGICIIEVKDWTLNFIKDINRAKVTTTTGVTLHNPVFRANQYFNLAKGLFESDTRLFDDEGFPTYNLYSKVIFANMPSAEVDIISDTLNQHPTKYIASEKIRNLNVVDFFDNESCSINSAQLLVLRAILFPEIKIFDAGASSEINTENLEEIYNTIKALDSEQEQFAKRIPNGHYMVSGVPGSGKTVILLSRAIFLLKENPTWRIKIVTYNRSLTHKIESRLNHLAKDFDFLGISLDNISISTFSKMALDVASIGVPQNAGNDFWNYELAKKALERATPTYDAILIDEYQDFYDDWIKLCIKLAKKHTVDGKQIENIFLAGDRLQSIYNPNEHIWKNIGIKIENEKGNVGGVRSKLLKHTYRAGKSHIELALKLLLSDRTLKKEVKKFYDGKNDIRNQTNIFDEIKFIEGGYDTISALLHNLINLVGCKPEEILILAPTHQKANSLFEQLPEDIRAKSRVTKDVVEKKLIITTYHSSKGLENKICILANIDDIKDLKIIYVGMTRASQRLYIHSNNFSYSAIANQIRQNSLTEADDDDNDSLPFTVKKVQDIIYDPLDDLPF